MVVMSAGRGRSRGLGLTRRLDPDGRNGGYLEDQSRLLPRVRGRIRQLMCLGAGGYVELGSMAQDVHLGLQRHKHRQHGGKGHHCLPNCFREAEGHSDSERNPTPPLSRFRPPSTTPQTHSEGV